MKRSKLFIWGIVMLLGVPAMAGGTEPQVAGKSPISTQGEKAANAIWTGESGAFAIRWTSSDIQAQHLKKPGRLAFSAAKLSRLGFQNFISPPNLDGSEEHITYERKFTLLSVVGSIISLEDELYYNIQPSAHPGLEKRFTAIDLAKSGEAIYVSPPEADLFELDVSKLGKVAKLTDCFPEKEVLKALLNDAIIQKALGEKYPQTLTELFDLLKDQRIEINEVPYKFPPDFLTRFAFHHLKGDKVAVRLGLPSAGGAARSLHAELDLMLPIPPALKKPLNLAASGKAGFLLADEKKIAGEAATRISFSFEGKGKVK